MGKPVVFVSINYRLGVFGFLGVPDLQWDGVMNAGLHDQQFAMRWVHKHIDKFGGDPDKVTIVGWSAGGGCVGFHNFANSSQGLFRYSISTSPALPTLHAHDSAINLKLYSKLLQKTGCDRVANGGAGGGNATVPSPRSKRRRSIGRRESASGAALACLRALPEQDIHKAHWEINQEAPPNTLTFQPVIDGSLISAHFVELAKRGRVNSQSTLVGTNRGEGWGFVDRHITTDDQAYQNIADFCTLDTNDAELMAGLKSTYGGAKDAEHKATAAVTDRMFVCPANLMSKAAAASGGDSYRYSYTIGGHIMDLGHWLSGSEDTSPSSTPRFDKGLIEMYLAFIYTGKPTLDGSTLPTFSNGHVALIDHQSDDQPPTFRQIDQDSVLDNQGACDFWEKHYQQAHF